MKRSRGPYSKHSRNLTAPLTRDPITLQLREFQAGQRVRLRIHARFPGKPPLKFNHRVGEVEARLSRAVYRVRLPDGDKQKHFDVRNVHLQPL
jgi:ribosomal protein L21E